MVTKQCYSMLEDKTISHLISWTPSSESFVMQPSHEFSKVLAYVSTAQGFVTFRIV